MEAMTRTAVKPQWLTADITEQWFPGAHVDTLLAPSLLAVGF